MILTEILSPHLFDIEYTQKQHALFCANKPIRHIVIENFLQPEMIRSLYEHFPSMKDMNTHYKGINEKKAEHSDFQNLDTSFRELHQILTTPAFISWLEQVTGIHPLETIEDRLGYGLHQGANNSFLDIHIDYNLHPIKKVLRKLNLIIFLNKDWKKDWGGSLELWDKDVRTCIQSIPPLFNRCVIFECSEVSYHGYNRISVPDGITRKSSYQYYFVPVSDHISFHDTIFRPRPKESFLKKTITYVKEYNKNAAKKILLKLGWERFLR